MSGAVNLFEYIISDKDFIQRNVILPEAANVTNHFAIIKHENVLR